MSADRRTDDLGDAVPEVLSPNMSRKVRPCQSYTLGEVLQGGAVPVMEQRVKRRLRWM